jgi:hypothetical protein
VYDLFGRKPEIEGASNVRSELLLKSGLIGSDARTFADPPGVSDLG